MIHYLLTHRIDATDAHGDILLACLPAVIALALCAMGALERFL